MAGNQGWVTIETAVIRLDTSLTPSGRFPAYQNVSGFGEWGIMLGFDAAVCVQKYEPWIIEAYNTSAGSSFALWIAGGQNDSTSLSPSGIIQGPRIAGTRNVNATGKDYAFSRVHNASVDRFGESGLFQYGYPEGGFAPTPTVGSTVPPCTVEHLF